MKLLIENESKFLIEYIIYIHIKNLNIYKNIIRENLLVFTNLILRVRFIFIYNQYNYELNII